MCWLSSAGEPGLASSLPQAYGLDRKSLFFAPVYFYPLLGVIYNAVADMLVPGESVRARGRTLNPKP